MPTYLLPSETGFNFSDGFTGLFQYIANQVPIFFPMVLLGFFLVVAVGGYMAESVRRGSANIFMWIAVGSFLTSTFALILSTIASVINLTTLGITFALTIISVGYYIYSENK